DEFFIPGIYEVNVDSSLNVRSEPSTISGEIYCALSDGDQVIILKTTADGKWGEIPWGGEVGSDEDSVAYVSMNYVVRVSYIEDEDEPEDPSIEEPSDPEDSGNEEETKGT